MSNYREKLDAVSKPVLAIAIALFISWVLLIIAGYDANKAFVQLYMASFRNLRAVGNSIMKTTPLIFTGVAIAYGFRGNVFNIGAEGQFILGAITASWAGVTFGYLPPLLLVPFILILAGASGALWAFIPGFLKVKMQVSEIITTIMFNYIAIRLLGYLVKGPLKEAGQTAPQTAKISANAMLPDIIPKTTLHAGFLIAVVLAIVIWYILFQTKLGFEVRATGLNPLGAKTSGVAVEKIGISTMLISGCIAGMGGSVELLGVANRLYEGFNTGIGYTAIAVSLLAASNPLGVLFSAYVFGVLNVGSGALQRMAGISSTFVNVTQGIIILFIAESSVEKKAGIKGPLHMILRKEKGGS
jgi:general nucleoside transport system permease protein